MISIIYRNFPNVQMIVGKRFLSGYLIKFSRAFLFPIFEFHLNFCMMQRGTQILTLTLVGVLTTRPHSKESRPEIQKSSGGRWGTRHGGGLLFPRLPISRSDVTIAL